MNKFKYTVSVFTALALLSLTACSGNTAQDSGENSTDPAEETPAEIADNIVLPEGFEEGFVYRKNDIVIQRTEYVPSETVDVIDFTLVNEGSENVDMKILPLLINGVVTEEGYYVDLEPKNPYPIEFYIDNETLSFAGIKKINTVDAWVSFKPESSESWSEPELILLLQNDADAKPAVLQHSDHVLYDQDGIKISSLGSYVSYFGASSAVYLLSNDTDSTVSTDTDYEFSLVDGEADSGRMIGYVSEETPPSRKSLLVVNVLSTDDYESVPFDTADTRLIISGEDNEEIAAVPVHLTMDGDTIQSAADDSYYNAYFRTESIIYELPSENELTEYLILFYQKGSGVLEGIINEIRIPKSDSITRELIESISLEDSFPGIEYLDFYEKVVEEDDDSFSYISIFRDLDDYWNLRSLIRTGFLNMDKDIDHAVPIDQFTEGIDGTDAVKISPEDDAYKYVHPDLY